MKIFQKLSYSLSSHIPAARWCLSLAVIAFTAVVSVYKYIDLADMATFSCLEVMYLILSDTMNIVFIYLPAFLFAVSGITFDSGFGAAAVLRHNSRREWLDIKLITYIVNTLIFFGAVLLFDIAVSYKVFGFSDVWSSDFVGFRVFSGQPYSDFAQSPIPTIAASCGAVLMLYVLCGLLNLFFSLLCGREDAGLLASLLIGIIFGLSDMLIAEKGLISQLLRIAVLIAASIAVYGACRIAVRKKDFGGKKMI